MCYNFAMHSNPTPTVCDGLATAYWDNTCTGVAAGLLRYGPPDTARPDKGQAPSVGEGAGWGKGVGFGSYKLQPRKFRVGTPVLQNGEDVSLSPALLALALAVGILWKRTNRGG